MEKFNGMIAVWGEQNEKYLRSVIAYADDSTMRLYYDEEHTKPVLNKDLFNLYKKNALIVCWKGKGEAEGITFYGNVTGLAYSPNQICVAVVDPDSRDIKNFFTDAKDLA